MIGNIFLVVFIIALVIGILIFLAHNTREKEAVAKIRAELRKMDKESVRACKK